MVATECRDKTKKNNLESGTEKMYFYKMVLSEEKENPTGHSLFWGWTQ